MTTCTVLIDNKECSGCIVHNSRMCAGFQRVRMQSIVEDIFDDTDEETDEETDEVSARMAAHTFRQATNADIAV